MHRDAVAVLTLVGLTDTASAFSCRLEIGGQVILGGGCQYEEDSDGSFRFFDDSDPGVSVYVKMNGDRTAQGYWPGPDGGKHAHDNLGNLSRDGARWINDQVAVCAWR